MKGIQFNTTTDIPSLEGKVVLVTGGNSGLGKHSILELAKHNPTEIWLGTRNINRGQEAVDEIKRQLPSAPPIKILQMDLSSLGSVREAAKTFCEQSQRLDLLLLNAGIMTLTHDITRDGYEIQFGTNHMGHALLVKLLLPTMLKTAEQPQSDVRLVVLSSSMHGSAPKSRGIDLETLKSKGEKLSATTLYGQSKLANILFAQELARRHPQLKVSAVHPGIVNTNLTTELKKNSLPMRVVSTIFVGMLAVPVEKGALNQLWASVSSDVMSGEYYEPVGVAGRGSKWTKHPELARELYTWTEEELKEYTI
jgi:retinol dehydrogenase-12